MVRNLPHASRVNTATSVSIGFHGVNGTPSEAAGRPSVQKLLRSYRIANMRNHFHPYPYAERNKNTPGNRALDQETQHSSPVDQTAARSGEAAAHSLDRSRPPCLTTPTARQPRGNRPRRQVIRPREQEKGEDCWQQPEQRTSIRHVASPWPFLLNVSIPVGKSHGKGLISRTMAHRHERPFFLARSRHP